ncbi:MAG: hypothetical protein U9Q20_08310 [Campylobacterota bacterium]|nr:hypothetical protein [Campylobacterota bacterium]
MSKELEEFSSLFDLVPNVSILNINTQSNKITKKLNELVDPYNGTITTVNTTNVRELKSKVKRAAYDYCVVENEILQGDDYLELLKIVNIGIRDSAYIIILDKKNSNLDVIYSLLEEFDYGAVSSIDIFDEYELVMGKKVHMWGMS